MSVTLIDKIRKIPRIFFGKLSIYAAHGAITDGSRSCLA